MSSALKPALPPSGTQTSTTNPAAVSKPLTGNPGMAQHAGAPGPYTTGPVGHVPQNLTGLPHAHSNMGPLNTNITTNINTVSNMSQMNMNQAASHNIQGVHTSPIKSSVLSPTLTAQTSSQTTGVTHGRPVSHAYLPSATNTPSSRDEEVAAIPASQNSSQIMAAHRAQQHLHEQQQQQQTISDRFKPQVNQQPQQQFQHQMQQIQQLSSHSQQQPQQTPQQPIQPNGTVSGSTENTCNKVTVPTSSIEAKIENTAPTVSIQNHVAPSADQDNIKQTENVPSDPVAQIAANSEQKLPSTTSTTEPIAEAPNQTANTPTKAAAVPKEASKQQSTMKLATTPRTNRKRETKTKASESPKSSVSSTKTPDGKSPGAQNNRPPDKIIKTARTPSEERKSKRTRTRTQPYQSPLPELALISKLSSSSASPSKPHDEKLIVFYKNEFLAVRNAEGGFYVCQAVQNVYKSSLRIRIRWLSQDKQDKIYIPDFYDVTDFDCILTNLNMERVEKGKYNLPKDELERTENILKRALAVESGEVAPSLTEEHPDGLDLSLFRDESQLKKKRKSLKRKSTEPISADNSSTNNKKTKKTPDKSKVRKLTKSPASKSTMKRNNQSLDRKSTLNSSLTSNDKKDAILKLSRRSDGGRAERAKRRGEATSPSVAKTSPVMDQKKARVLAKVALKTAISAGTSVQNKKKAGRNTPTGNGKAVAANTPSKVSTKTSTRSTSATIGPASTSSSRRGKKTKK